MWLTQKGGNEGTEKEGFMVWRCIPMKGTESEIDRKGGTSQNPRGRRSQPVEKRDLFAFLT